MAKAETWAKLKHFKKTENWGDPDAINDEHLLRLDDFRSYLGCPIHVTHAVKNSGHSKKSFHYPRTNERGEQIGACATDIVIPTYDGSLIDLILDATRFGFVGIGYYPHWTYRGVKVGGLHLDSRPLSWDLDETLNYSHSRWIGIVEDGIQKYIPMTFQNLMKYACEIKDIDFNRVQ